MNFDVSSFCGTEKKSYTCICQGKNCCNTLDRGSFEAGIWKTCILSHLLLHYHIKNRMDKFCIVFWFLITKTAPFLKGKKMTVSYSASYLLGFISINKCRAFSALKSKKKSAKIKYHRDFAQEKKDE